MKPIWLMLCLTFSAVLVSGGCSGSSSRSQSAVRELGGRYDLDDDGEIEFVNLSSTAIGDGDLQQLVAMKGLKKLWLYNTNITDAGMAHVEQMTGLEVIVLGKTRISDSGARRLLKLKSLKEIYLDGTRASEDSILELKDAFPDITIVY